MTCKANTQHLRLLAKLKKVEKFKNDALCITIETWDFSTGTKETDINLWSSNENDSIFKGNTMVELERFINSKRKEAGIFIPRK